MPLYWYFIRNERLCRSIDIVAPSAEAACGDLCWSMAECVVVRVGEVYDSKHPPARREPELRSGTPRGVTARSRPTDRRVTW